MKYVIPLDVSKGKSNVVLYEESTCLSEFEIFHTRLGFQTLLATVNSCPNPPDIGYESTGIYSKVIDRLCTEKQLSFFA